MSAKPTSPKQKVINFNRGQEIFKEGHPSTKMYLVKSGIVSITIKRGDVEIELSRIQRGEIIGELSFFDRKPRSASAIAVSEVELVEIEYDSLHRVYEPLAPYLKSIITSVVQRLRKADERIEELTGQVRQLSGNSATKSTDKN